MQLFPSLCQFLEQRALEDKIGICFLALEVWRKPSSIVTQLPVSWTLLGLAGGAEGGLVQPFIPSVSHRAWCIVSAQHNCLFSWVWYVSPGASSSGRKANVSWVCLGTPGCLLQPIRPALRVCRPAACAPAPGGAHVGLPWERSLCPFTVCALPLLSKSLSWFSHFCKRKSHKFFLLQVSFGSRICSGKDELFYPSLLLLFSS